jgi:hypothetical protein
MSDTISNDEAFNLISFGESKPSVSSAPPAQATALPPVTPAETKKAPKVVDVTQVPAPVLSVPKVDLPPANVAQQASQINKSMAEVTPVPVPPNPVEVAGKSLGMSDSVLPYALGIGTGALAAYSAGKLKDRIEASKKQSAPRIEPTMAPEPAPERIVPPQQTQAAPMQTAEQKLQSMQQARAARPGPVAPPPVANQPWHSSQLPPTPASAPLPPGATFADLAAMSAPQTTVQPITTALDEATKPLAPAPASEAKKPVKPTVDVSGLTKEQAGMKRYLVAQYGGGDAGEAAYKQVVSILGEPPAYEKGKGGGLTGEQLGKVKEWRKETIPGPKINLTHEMKSTFKDISSGKVAKGAGALSVLATIPGFAEAAQKGDWAKVTDMLTDFIVPPFAGSSQLAPGTLDGRPASAKMMELSPIPGVGAGRGFVNPPMR